MDIADEINYASYANLRVTREMPRTREIGPNLSPISKSKRGGGVLTPSVKNDPNVNRISGLVSLPADETVLNKSKKKKKTAKFNLPPTDERKHSRCSKHARRNTMSSISEVPKIFKAGSILNGAASQRDLSNISSRNRMTSDNSCCVKACCKHFCSRSRSNNNARIASPRDENIP